MLNRQGKIPSLYAAGKIVGGFHSASYMSGTAVGKVVISGRIAGRNVAKGLWNSLDLAFFPLHVNSAIICPGDYCISCREFLTTPVIRLSPA